MPVKLLVVEDEKSILKLLRTILTANKYEVVEASTGAEALSLITSHCPDLILLDLGLPDMDGNTLLSSVRKWTSTPVIVLSARTHESDKVEAIDLGADDYITKPFGASELLARIRMALRHTQTMSQNAQIARTGQFHSGGLTIDYNKYRVYVDGVDAQLTQGEYRIVALLGKYAGRVLTYDFLMKELWGPCSKGDNKILRVNMANIRRKIEKTPAQPKYIFTEVGVGYRMAEGDTGYKIDTAGFSGKGGTVAETLNNLGDGLETALQEQVKSERLKADLITNVSHDIKTPLTSIINYVDLLKREQIPNEKVQRYLEILDQKSQRLKNLTEDLVEASKASSGNLKLDIQDIDLVELVQQTNGEFEEKFQLRHLELVSSLPDRSIFIAADGRRLWRVLENLYNNAFKYAMENSRVYVDLVQEGDRVAFIIKNVSASPLNISPDELTERFVRGDVARTTEGSGLGLSIAKDLTRLQNGVLEITIDGDLFKVQVSFPVIR